MRMALTRARWPGLVYRTDNQGRLTGVDTAVHADKNSVAALRTKIVVGASWRLAHTVFKLRRNWNDRQVDAGKSERLVRLD